MRDCRKNCWLRIFIKMVTQMECLQNIQDYITENLYTCTNKILRGLGKMYSGGGEITTNIDAYGGKGTAIFVADAIEIYCDNAE